MIETIGSYLHQLFPNEFILAVIYISTIIGVLLGTKMIIQGEHSRKWLELFTLYFENKKRSQDKMNTMLWEHIHGLEETIKIKDQDLEDLKEKVKFLTIKLNKYAKETE